MRTGEALAAVLAVHQPASGSRIVLTAGGPGGTSMYGWGRSTDKSTQMVVDTGATSVALSVAEAQRLGIEVPNRGNRVQMSTANGVHARAGVIKLNSVRVGDVVSAAV